MRFEVFHPGLLGRPDVIAVDMIHSSGLWGLCFSHHPPHNNLPRYAADTTTEGVLRFLDDARHGRDSLDLDRLADYTITTHHLDADALLPVWALLHPDAALENRSLLERIARSGDFFIYLDDVCAKINFAIETTHHRLRGAGLPGERLVNDRLTERCFAQLLPQLESLLTESEAYASLWDAAYRTMQTDLEYLAQPGHVTEMWERHLNLVETDHDPDVHALNTVCRNDLLLVWRTDSTARRLDVRPAIAWYELTSIPHRPHYDLNDLAHRLNHQEGASSQDLPWRFDAGPVCLSADASVLTQEALLNTVDEWLAAAQETQVSLAYRADVREVFPLLDRHATFTSHRRFAESTQVSYTPGKPYNGLHYLGAASYSPLLQNDENGVTSPNLTLCIPSGKSPVPFAVSDDFYWNRANPEPLLLSLTYEDSAEGVFWVEVDSWSAIYHPTPQVALCGDCRTKTVTFPLNDARLGAGQEGGADLRLMRSRGTPLKIRTVSLHTAASDSRTER